MKVLLLNSARRLMVAALLSALPGRVLAQEPAGAGPYQYPLRPGTAEWAKRSPGELRALCDVPLELCRKMPTEALLQTCLDYPYIVDLHLANDGLGGGIRLLAPKLTAMREFMARSDAGRVAFAKYKEIAALPANRLTGKTLFDNALVFGLLAEDSILHQLDSRELRDLGRTAITLISRKRSTAGFSADEGFHARIVARLVIDFQTPPTFGAVAVKIEDLGPDAFQWKNVRSSFCPEKEVLDRLIEIGKSPGS